jgi:hypothetical protein
MPKATEAARAIYPKPDDVHRHMFPKCNTAVLRAHLRSFTDFLIRVQNVN